MKDNVKLIVIPDVHGRDFWENAIPYIKSGVETVFLGDYHDPYPGEGINTNKSVENFERILAFAKEYPNVHLLIGNHDCGYFISMDICECRHDYYNHIKIGDMFNDDLFHFAYETTINGKRFMFSHAGISTKWVDMYKDIFGETNGTIPNAETINKARIENPKKFTEALCVYSNSRGFSGFDFGSIVWNDIRDFITDNSQYENVTQIVGHTQLRVPVQIKNVICIDTHECYYINDNGDIFALNDDVTPIQHETQK